MFSTVRWFAKGPLTSRLSGNVTDHLNQPGISVGSVQLPLAKSKPPAQLQVHQKESERFPISQSPSMANTKPCRTTRSPISIDSFDFVMRASRLGEYERQVLKYYGGIRTHTRTRLLEKMESYRRENHDQPPIVSVQNQERAGNSRKSRWKCQICSRVFSTLQRVAIHLTSGEWKLVSWPCPVESWYVLPKG